MWIMLVFSCSLNLQLCLGVYCILLTSAIWEYSCVIINILWGLLNIFLTQGKMSLSDVFVRCLCKAKQNNPSHCD